MITRRSFVSVLSLVLLTRSRASGAQQPGRVYRIGSLASTIGTSPNRTPLLERLGELGWVEGRNLVIENRHMGPDREKLAAAAKELVGLGVDLILTGGGAEAPQIAKNETKTIPIVFFIADDPVRTGLIRNLSRPEGNVTGFSTMNADLDGKRLELLREALPGLKRVGVMWSPVDPSGAVVMSVTEGAARLLKVQLEPLAVNRAEDLSDAFADAKKRAVDAVMILGTPILFPHQTRIAELAAAARLPTISAWRRLPEAGGLLSYGPDLIGANRRIAAMIDRILKGAKPVDIPVERPTKFELVINMKAAKSLGLKIPQSVLIRATEVIH